MTHPEVVAKVLAELAADPPELAVHVHRVTDVERGGEWAVWAEWDGERFEVTDVHFRQLSVDDMRRAYAGGN